jgi:glycosyltransferase involved in cell wall biosynthesis
VGLKAQKISIALCTYNGARFLPEQLESFLVQSRLPDELVVCDDRSVDDTVPIVRAFADRAPFRVEININERNLGSTRNFEKAISRCTGDLIFLADQDDVWLPQKTEAIARAFDDPAVVMCFSDAILVDENLEALGTGLWERAFPLKHRARAREGRVAEVLLWQNVVTGATAAIRASAREAFVPIPTEIPNMIHDAWIALVLSVFGKIAMVEEPLIKYRQHHGQQLGILFEPAGRLSHAERLMSYDRQIDFLRSEKTRLLELRRILKDLPPFSGTGLEEKADGFVVMKEEIITHYKARRDLPRQRMRRLEKVFREIGSGRYHKHSRGLLSAAKDLFETW